jgi:hypothetical protein
MMYLPSLILVSFSLKYRKNVKGLLNPKAKNNSKEKKEA